MNFQLYNDKAYTFPLKCQNAAGADKPWPGNPSAMSSSPFSLGATVVGDATAFFLQLFPRVKASPGISITVSCTGMAPVTLVADVVPDPDLLSVGIDTASATTQVQAVPAAPGP